MGDRLRPALALGFFLGGALAVTPALADETVSYSYDARGRLVAVSRSGTINNGFTAAYSYDQADNRTNVLVTAAAPVFTISDVSVSEGGTLNFTVTRSGPSNSAVGVSFASANGTATVVSDYTAVSGTLSFASGQTTNSVSVTTIDDTAVESAETVLVNLTNPTGGAVIGDAQGVGTINDNDVGTPPSFAISDASSMEGPGETAVFTVSRSGSTTGTYSVTFATANGNATSASDYFVQSGTLNFASGETAKTIVVTLRDDLIAEPVEYFSVNLSSPTGGATISDSQGTGTIIDDDDSGTCLAGAAPTTAASEDDGSTSVPAAPLAPC